MDDLQEQVDALAHSAVLLIASDFDGTLAPLVNVPAEAQVQRESVVALKALAALPQTHVAIISGRALHDLAQHVAEAEEAHLVGSHGSEFEAGFASPLAPEALQRLQSVVALVQRFAAQTPGAVVEQKPASVTFHYRMADPAQAAAAVQELLKTVAAWPGLQIRDGKMVVELSVVPTNKGRALASLRQRLGATAVIFFGDDLSDEDAVATLTGPDLGFKVGPGPTAAKARLADTAQVAHVLAALAEKRAAWLAGSEAVPIQHHSLLSDQRTFALVEPRGRICWLCLPRLDSSALFASLLGGPAAGFFDLAPLEPEPPPSQTYLGPTFLLETRWDNVRMVDYLDCSGGRPFQRAGRTDLVRVVTGQGRVRLTFAPRIDFGSLETRLQVSDAGVTIEGLVDPCVLVSPAVRWNILQEGPHQTAQAEVDLGGGPLVLELRFGTASLAPARLAEPQRRAQTQNFWTLWAQTLTLPSVRPDLVLRSALVLRALCYGPSGAIAAAATTSLPESAGGVRNWDYRFCWPRDAALAAAALLRLGAPGPALKFLDWILGILDSAEPNSLLRPVYSVSGGHLGPEGEIAALAGYRGSRPVRIGNVAAQQVQLDVLGPVADLLCLLAQNGESLTPEHWRMLQAMVAAVAQRWREADHGIWEIRGPRRHHVHSKVMCWQTVSSALHVAAYLGHRRPDWDDLRTQIAQDVLTHGWNHQHHTFTASYGDSQIDAAALSVGLSGLLVPEDPRFAATVQAVETALREGPTVYRYRYDDGLPGIEGGFNLCTSWLIEAYALLGRWHDAEELFDDYTALAGPTGLLAEEYDPRTRQALGNFPQAYSHLGLINAAVRLAQPH